MDSTVDRQQLALHTKWHKTPSTYVKPPHDPETCLINVPNATTVLGYVRIESGKIVSTCGSAACEFIQDDPEQLRQWALVRKPQGFLVYYKHAEFWYATRHFQTLADAIPYLQSGIRVLIEIKP